MEYYAGICNSLLDAKNDTELYKGLEEFDNKLDSHLEDKSDDYANDYISDLEDKTNCFTLIENLNSSNKSPYIRKLAGQILNKHGISIRNPEQYYLFFFPQDVNLLKRATDIAEKFKLPVFGIEGTNQYAIDIGTLSDEDTLRLTQLFNRLKIKNSIVKID